MQGGTDDKKSRRIALGKLMQLIHAWELESISPFLTALAGVQFGEVHPDRFHGHPSDTGALGRIPVKCWTPAGEVGKGWSMDSYIYTK